MIKIKSYLLPNKKELIKQHLDGNLKGIKEYHANFGTVATVCVIGPFQVFGYLPDLWTELSKHFFLVRIYKTDKYKGPYFNTNAGKVYLCDLKDLKDIKE